MAFKTKRLLNLFTGKFVICGRNFQSCCALNSNSKQYDIIVTGGGMVGTAMACSLSQSKKLSDTRMLLLEGGPKEEVKQKLSTSQSGYSNRVVSLNPGTRKHLESLGVWPHIASNRFKTVKKMQVWDACSDAIITFNDDLEQDVSYIVENDVVLGALATALEEKSAANVTIQYNKTVKETKLPQRYGEQVVLKMADGDTYSCKLLIGADGFNSQTRRVMGQQYLSWSYDQLGVVATLRLAEPTENVVAWQRFLPTGPIALLPLTDELSSLVWSTSVDQGKRLLKMADEEFVDAVNDAFWRPASKHPLVESASGSLDSLLTFLTFKSAAVRQLPPSVAAVTAGSRAAFPLGFGHATQYVAPGAALIGDAAHRVHPLAGQGVNLGFGDIQCLTRLLANAVYSGSSIASMSVLRDYESTRQRHNFPTMVAIDGLHKLYTTSLTPVVLVRSLGLQLTHSLPLLKKAIMQHAAAS